MERQGRYNPEPGMRQPAGTPFAMSCDEITGMGVTNDQGQDLGKIERLMIDASSGRILYAAVSFGGFLGMGEKHFAVPWEAFSLSPNRERLVLNVSRERLEHAPGFDKDNWPRHPDESFSRSTYDYYGYRPWWNR